MTLCVRSKRIDAASRKILFFFSYKINQEAADMWSRPFAGICKSKPFDGEHHPIFLIVCLAMPQTGHDCYIMWRWNLDLTFGTIKLNCRRCLDCFFFSFPVSIKYNLQTLVKVIHWLIERWHYVYARYYLRIHFDGSSSINQRIFSHWLC